MGHKLLLKRKVNRPKRQSVRNRRFPPLRLALPSTPLPSHRKYHGPTPLFPVENRALQDNSMRLMLVERANKKRLKTQEADSIAKSELEEATTRSKAAHVEVESLGLLPGSCDTNSAANASTHSPHRGEILPAKAVISTINYALQDYSMQLMPLEQQNKKRQKGHYFPPRNKSRKALLDRRPKTPK